MKNIIFCGSGKLAHICLKVLIENGYNILFSLTTEKNEAAYFFQEKSIDYYFGKPRKGWGNFAKIFNEHKSDFLISVNYLYILPKQLFSIPKYAINIHGALLPKYRGRTPHVWAIINGEKKAGVTCHIIEEVVDSGDIIQQVEVPIEDDDTGYTLLQKYEKIYPDILLKSLEHLQAGKPLIKQDESEATYFGKRIPEMGYINFNQDAESIINFVRAQATPYPGAYYFLGDGTKIIVNKIRRIDSVIFFLTKEIGKIEYNILGEYFVRCSDGILEITDYKLEM